MTSLFIFIFMSYDWMASRALALSPEIAGPSCAVAVSSASKKTKYQAKAAKPHEFHNLLHLS
jgi:hypothetical protein